MLYYLGKQSCSDNDSTQNFQSYEMLYVLWTIQKSTTWRQIHDIITPSVTPLQPEKNEFHWSLSNTSNG